jgi:DNA-binding beta-propeller fold protein YncE
MFYLNWVRHRNKICQIAALAVVAAASLSVAAVAQLNPPLQLSETIEVPDVNGRIDSVEVDPKGKRLFICAPETSSVEVIDLNKSKHIYSVKNVGQPQASAYLPDCKRLVVSNHLGGDCLLFEGETFDPFRKIKLNDDADRIRYDPSRQQLYVGYGTGGLGIIEPVTGKLVGQITLSGHPEGFELEKFGNRIYANIPEAAQVVAIDKEHKIVISTWPLKNSRGNHALALDEPGKRLFVVTQRPPKLIVMNNQTGKTVAELPADADIKEVFYDDAHRRIYGISESGFIDVWQQKDPDHYVGIARIATAPGAAHAAYSPELGLLYLGIPRYGGNRSVVQVYSINP